MSGVKEKAIKSGNGRRSSQASGGGSGSRDSQMSAIVKISSSTTLRQKAREDDDFQNSEIWYDHAQTTQFFSTIFGHPGSRESKTPYTDLFVDYIEAKYPDTCGDASGVKDMERWIRSSMICVLLNRPSMIQRAELLWWLFDVLNNNGCMSAAFAVEYLEFNPALDRYAEYLRHGDETRSSTATIRWGDSYGTTHLELWDRWIDSFFKPTIYSFAQSLSNVPHPLASVNGIVPSVIAGVRGMVELPPFEGFAEINFGNVSHFVGIDHT